MWVDVFGWMYSDGFGVNRGIGRNHDPYNMSG
jgi:hypothetical protein